MTERETGAGARRFRSGPAARGAGRPVAGRRARDDAASRAERRSQPARPHLLLLQRLRLFAVEIRLAGAQGRGLAAAGIVDFDVLDGVDEFLDAGRADRARSCCARLESRVFVPEFAELVINSPGEPGVAYHMGVGFPRGAVASRPDGDARRRGEADARHDRTRQRLSRSGRARLRPRRRAADAERQRDRAPPVRRLRAQGDSRSFPTPRAAPPSGASGSATRPRTARSCRG